MLNRVGTSKLLAAAMMFLVFSACGSSGIGDILGGSSGSRNGRYEIRGTVESVDTRSQSIYLTGVSGVSSRLASDDSSRNATRVYYDQQTQVSYNGKSYRPDALERGDQVSVRVDDSSNRLTAESITVTYNVASGNGNSNPSGAYGSTVRGTIQYLDTSRRTITLDRGYGSAATIDYATNTPVRYGSTNYRVSDLQRGDEIEVSVNDLGGGRLSARDINVLRSVNSGNAGSSTSNSTFRGTVRYVDTSRRTIELESTSFISGFNRGNSGNVMTVQYDSSSRVEVSGQGQAVSNLERGDVIEVEVENSGNALPFARRIILVRDVNSR